MAVRLLGNVSENTVKIHPSFLESANGFITFNGVGATVEIEEQHASGTILFSLGDKALISIGYACVLGAMSIHAVAAGSRIVIGARVGFNGKADLATQEPSSITIGDECLIAHELSISTSDVHHIVDACTGERLNPPRDVTVGAKTWIGGRTTLLKGARIGVGSVIGLGSIVGGEFEDGTLIAGIPARAIRTGITWHP